MVRTAFWYTLATLTTLAAGPVAAQPVPSVNSPAISVQRGQTLDLAVGGANLGAVSSVGMRDPQGLDVSLAKPEKDAKPNDGQARLKVVAAPDAAPGEREMRLISPTGVSNPLRVIVEQYPLLVRRRAEQHARSRRRRAAAGGADRADRRARATSTATASRPARASTWCSTSSRPARGSPLDAAVAVYDAAGKEIASDNDTHGADPFVAFDVPADGSYVLEIRDLQYRGGGDYAYRVAGRRRSPTSRRWCR